MTLDDLEKIYGAAYWTRPELEPDGARRAGIAAVVRALRDEVFGTIDSNGDQWSADGAWDWFNEILGDAGEKVAGVIGLDPVGAGLSPASGQAPATDPAPAVCVWEMEQPCVWVLGCDATIHIGFANEYKKCLSCGKPIKFTEAKT